MTPLLTALAGLVLGVIAVPLLSNSGPFVPFVALVALPGLRRDSRAAGGGFLVAFSGWWVYFVRQAVERCDAFTLAACIALAGTALVAIAFRDRGARPA
jgi:hypothetical protein